MKSFISAACRAKKSFTRSFTVLQITVVSSRQYSASQARVIVVASATRHFGTSRYVIIQAAALLLGIVLYILFTLLDIDIIAERRELLFLFNLIFIALLRTPLGPEIAGNRSWLHIPGVPVNIQPAEICKITFIILLAKVMAVRQNSISRPSTVLRLGFPMREAAETDLLEQQPTPLAVEDGSVKLHFAPFEIKTILLS